MTFSRPPAGDDPLWPRASAWLGGGDPATAPLRVVGVPCSVGSISPSEAWRTPPAVRQALARLSPWDPIDGIDLEEALPCADLGDWPVAELDLDPAVRQIRELAADLDPSSAVHVFLGGDNAITRPWVTGLCGPDLSRVGLVTLDAHHDVRHLDDGPRNGTPVRGLIEDGLPGEHVVQLGIGSFTNSWAYANWCRVNGIRWWTADEVRAVGAATAMQEALASLGDCDVIAVDLDVDVLDSAHAPACPGARPSGLAPADLFAVARVAGADPRVVGADLVEVDATADVDGRTVMATAMALLAFASGVAGR